MTRNHFYAALVLTAAFAAQNTRAASNNRVLEAANAGTILPQAAPVIEDLGDLRPLDDKPLMNRLHITATTKGEFVSNARLIGKHGSSDFLFMPSVTADFVQPLQHGFSLDLNARAESFMYARFNQYSFWGFSGAATVNYQYSEKWPVFYVSAEPYWYNSVTTGRQLGSAIAVSTGVERTWVCNRDRTVFFAGYNFSCFGASPSADNRNLHRATVGVTHQLRPAWYTQLYYSFQFSDFRGAGREDYRNLVGLNLVHTINANWSANISTTFVNNNSTNATATYQNFTAGAGLSFHY